MASVVVDRLMQVFPPTERAHSRPVQPRSLPLTSWTLALLSLGLTWRTLRYALQFPMWGDEAFICLNFIDQGYLDLTRQLRHAQVAPLFFLWSELTAYRLLGASEWALRLLPFLAGLGGLALFWRLAKLTLSPLAGAVAVGTLAVSMWPVSMCSFVKPYSFDLFWSMALLLPAVKWLKQPERIGWLIWLVVLVPVALLASYPAVFVAGAVSAALLPTLWQRREWTLFALYLAYNVSMLLAFQTSYLLVGRQQLDPAAKTVESYLLTYWAHGFPPLSPLPLLRWLVLIHTGRMLAYPIGDANGGSTLTFLFCLVGIWQFWRLRRWSLLLLCLTPFGLGLLAAFMQRYPYGGCCRLSQHVAPAICLFFGAGLAAAIDRFPTLTARRRATLAALSVLALVGGAGMLRDVLKPYKTQADLWTRRLVREVLDHAGPDDQIVVLNPANEVKPLFQWFLAQHGPRVSWNGTIDSERIEHGTSQVWCLYFPRPIWRSSDSFGPEPETFTDSQSALSRIAACLAESKRPWRLAAHIPYTVVPSDDHKAPIERCDVYRWVCSNAEDRVHISCWP